MTEQVTLMTAEEIHDFGVEIVFGCLRKEGYEIKSVNAKLGMNPQIVAHKDGQLIFVHVRTACYPNKGQIASEGEFFTLLEHAKKHDATPYFAPVGIARADTKNEEECGTPVKGAPYHAMYNGMLIMTTSDKVRVWDEKSKTFESISDGNNQT